MVTTINKFKKGTNAYVAETITLQQILNTIKNGDTNLESINNIRTVGKGNPGFDKMKMELPSHRFNFKFTVKASNDNIICPTGLIYIDVDACDTIDTSNPYIHAAWKSISLTGFGLLVKVDGLTLQNYASTYNAVSFALGLSTDVGARKATQQTMLSYDTNLYHNNDSIVFKAVTEKVSSTTILKEEKKERLIEVKDTFFNKEDKIRFNNINQYFVNNDSDYIVFDEKEALCIPFIPKRVGDGKRNTIMFSVLSQYSLLNPSYGEGFLMACAKVINNNFINKYAEDKVKSIVTGVIKKRENGTLVPFLNKERRLLFNPNNKLDKKAKQQLTGKEMGKVKTAATRSKIYNAVMGWDFEINGKITQDKVKEVIEVKSILTVKRNWEEVKDLVKDMNLDFKNGITSYTKTDVLSIDNLEVIVEPIIEEIEEEIEGIYSEIEFKLYNNKTVYILTQFATNWETKWKDYKGLIKNLQRETTQYAFDYYLKNQYEMGGLN